MGLLLLRARGHHMGQGEAQISPETSDTWRSNPVTWQQERCCFTSIIEERKRREEREAMAHSKEDIKYGTAQAKVSEDEMLREAYKHGTPLEGGKIAESEPVELFTGARRVAEAKPSKNIATAADANASGGGGGDGEKDENYKNAIIDH